MAGAEKSLESSFCLYNFNIAYAVKFFGPSASFAIENKPNKVRTRFFRFSAVSHMPARRAISPAANSLSLRALEGCYRSQLTTMPGCLRGEFNGACTAADGCRDSRAWRQRSSRLTARMRRLGGRTTAQKTSGHQDPCFSSLPNDQDKLPGRLQRRYVSKNRNAGPVNFIGWLASGATSEVNL